MGQYLFMGIAQTITLYKPKQRNINDLFYQNEEDYKDYSYRKLEEFYSHYFDLSIYQVEEHDEQSLVFTIKPKILEEHLASFAEEVLLLLGYPPEKISQEMLEDFRLSEAELFEKLENEKVKDADFFIHDSHTSWANHCTFLKRDNICSNFELTLLYFYANGKCFMDDMGPYFQYLQNMLKEVSHNPLKGAFFIDIHG